MKVRIGFVSNSSTSSYLVITTKDVSDKVLKKMTQKERDIISKVIKTRKFLGHEVVEMSQDRMYEETYVNEKAMSELFDDEYDIAYDAIDKWFELVLKTADTNSIFVRETEG
jgi:hypothetical protein